MVVTPEQFSLCLALPNKKLEDIWYPLFVPVMEKAGINTPLRIAHFLTQIRHESMSLTRLSELYNGNKYDYFENAYGVNGKNKNRIAMGHTQIGDGAKYYGRGPIQCTWKANYDRFGKYIGVDFVKDPDKMLEPRYGSQFAGWFWSVDHTINIQADADNMIKVRKIVNGGTYGLDKCRLFLLDCKRVLMPNTLVGAEV